MHCPWESVHHIYLVLLLSLSWYYYLVPLNLMKGKDLSQRDLPRGLRFIVWHENFRYLRFCSLVSVQLSFSGECLSPRARPLRSARFTGEKSTRGLAWAVREAFKSKKSICYLQSCSALSISLPWFWISLICIMAFPFLFCPALDILFVTAWSFLSSRGRSQLLIPFHIWHYESMGWFRAVRLWNGGCQDSIWGKWCYTGSFREGTGWLLLHVSEEGNGPCNVILCRKCSQISTLTLLCRKRKLLQRAILQHKIPVFPGRRMYFDHWLWSRILAILFLNNSGFF